MAVNITIAFDKTVIRQIDNVPWQSKMNAQDALEHAYQTGAGYAFVLQYFGTTLGYEVVSIDNIASQFGSDTYLFWEFSQNSKVSKIGIDEATLSDGDNISFNYTRYDPAAHGTGRYAAIKAQALTKK
jgi:hypothetical protein